MPGAQQELKYFKGDHFSVNMTGGRGDGAADNTTAFANAMAALALNNGGRLLVPEGTFLTGAISLLTSFPVEIVGNGIGVTIIKLKDGANSDVITNEDFDTLTCSNAVGGVFRCAIRNLTIDGNKDNQSGSSTGIKIYGHGFYLENIVVQNCLTDGIYTEYAVDPAFTDPSTDLECHCSNIKTIFNGRHGWRYRGPHDGIIQGLVSYGNGGWNWLNESSYGQVDVAVTAVSYVANSGHPFTDGMTQINIAGTVYPFTYISPTSGTIVGSLTVTGAAFHAFNGGGLHLKDVNTFLGTLGGMKVCDSFQGENIAATTATGQGMLITADSGAVHIKNGTFASSADVGLAIHNSNNIIDGLVANSLVGVYIAGGFTQLKVNFFSCTTFLSYGPGPFNWDIIEANGTLPTGGTLVSGTAPIYGIYNITAIQNGLPITFIRVPQLMDVLGTLKVGLVSEDGKLLLFSDNGGGAGVNYIQSVSGDETARRDLTIASVNSEPIALLTAIAKQFRVFNSNTTDTVGTRTTLLVVKNGVDNVGNALSPFQVLSNAGSIIAEIHPNGDVVSSQDLVGSRVIVANTGAILYRSGADLVVQVTTGAVDFFSTTLGASAMVIFNSGNVEAAGLFKSDALATGKLLRSDAAHQIVDGKCVLNSSNDVDMTGLTSGALLGSDGLKVVPRTFSGTAGVLHYNGGAYAFSLVDLTSDVTGQLPSANINISSLESALSSWVDGKITTNNADYYDRGSIDTLLANYYTKSEIDTQMAGKSAHPHTHPFTGGGHTHGGGTIGAGTTDSASDSGTTGNDP